MIALLLAVAVGAPAQTRFEAKLIALVNVERMSVGVAPLQYDKRLHDAGDLWIRLCHGTLAHALPAEDCRGRYVPDLDGDGVCAIWERQVACGWLQSGSEAGASNANDPEWLVYAWMQSPAHRNGLLDPWWTHAGAGRGFGLTYMELGGP